MDRRGPLDKLESRRSPPSHSSARDDEAREGNPTLESLCHQVGAKEGDPSSECSEKNQWHNPYGSQRSIWHFSQIEVEHLIQATMAFTIALAFMTTEAFSVLINNIGAFIIGGAIYFHRTLPAFVLHELAHKFSARKYGCWAEFRASPSGLRFGVFLVSSDWNSVHGPRSRDGGR